MVFLVLTCFVLAGCPGGELHEYQYIGTDSSSNSKEYALIKYDESTELLVTCGYYSQFKAEKTGLIVNVKVKSKIKLKKEFLIKNVNSSNLGVFNNVKDVKPFYFFAFSDTINSLLYNVPMGRKRKARNNWNKIENDTISITLQNGKELLFVNQGKIIY